MATTIGDTGAILGAIDLVRVADAAVATGVARRAPPGARSPQTPFRRKRLR